ncbi:hypothetical protein, partial [Shewanella algae]|uniref:hypothetical protein n=1 Tax=Shewanella algae TaxID=38313 RepID=UPI001AAF1B71
MFQLQCSWESCGAGNGQHQVSASMAKSGSWARGISAAVFLGEICGAGNGQHQVSASMAKSGSWARGISAAVFLGELRRRQWSAPGIGLNGQEWQLGPGCFSCSVPGRAAAPAMVSTRYRPQWPRVAAGPGVFLLQCFWERSAALAMVSTRYRPRWPRVAAGPGVFLLQCSWESCGAGNGQHQVSASMAKSGSWARGVSAAVFLGELRRRQWSAPGIGLNGQEWQLGPGYFCCSVSGRDLRRWQWSAPGIGLDGQEWQLGPG